MQSDPAVQARRAARQAECFAAHRRDPAFIARHRQACIEATARAMACPEERERRRQRGLEIGLKNLQQAAGPELSARRGEINRARHLAWCPREYWALNKSLKRKGFGLAERKEIILAEVAGTAQHAKREVANHQLRMQLKHEREVMNAY
ncbi:hypothetical protein GO308_12755 [Sphingomonas sp. SFZ2018-12]|uniref:hypothetical protein n=1 Tax=Sphingomonas sp. SFZ2018-12 TaxID=2683197 RepID=UPI001F109CF8|nr:hypothetical protein [Sphingomonas sp. SFZ2018-12]MCH4893985.1 hypothetical protein [Sphingomonas sp. SFZ2018-12]